MDKEQQEQISAKSSTMTGLDFPFEAIHPCSILLPYNLANVICIINVKNQWGRNVIRILCYY